MFPEPVPIPEVYNARQRLGETISRTPLIPLNIPQNDKDIYLKLENLHPTGSFKVRGAGNALAAVRTELDESGVWTVSAGNMAQALAWHARREKIPCHVVVPDDAPAVKVQAILDLGAELIKVPFSQYQEIQSTHTFSQIHGRLIHPFADAAVMAGNATIALEILEDLPDVQAILAPYGGGGLSCAIASVVQATRSGVKVYGCESSAATPLTSSLAARKPVTVDFKPSFISGIGAPFIFPQMWPLAQQLLNGSLVATLPQVADTIRQLAERHHIIVEGAGAVSLAAALNCPPDYRKIVCIISGGNLDPYKLSQILEGHVPT